MDKMIWFLIFQLEENRIQICCFPQTSTYPFIDFISVFFQSRTSGE